MVKIGDQVIMVGWKVERIGVTDEIVRITRMDGNDEGSHQAVYHAPMSWLHEAGPIDLPPWQDVDAKGERNQPLTELEQFVYDNEPSTYVTSMEWRANLASVLMAISGRMVRNVLPSYIPVQEASPPVVELGDTTPMTWTVQDGGGLVCAAIDYNQCLTFAEGAIRKVMMRTTEGQTVDLYKFFVAARNMIAALDDENFDWKFYYDAMKAMMEGKQDAEKSS